MAKFKIRDSRFENPRLCRGSVYIIVLSVSMIVTVIGLASLFAVRVQRRSAEMAKECAEARLCAQSAIELGLYYVSSNPDWRTTWSNGTWLSNQPLGSGTFTLEGIDPIDGDLANSEYNPLVLTGVGINGIACHKTHVMLVAEGGALTCLEVSLQAGGDLVFDGGLTSDQTISTNQSATQSTTNPIIADVEAVGTISLNNHTGTATEGITPRTMPDINNVFEEYLAYGVFLDIYNDIPKVAGKYKIQEEVLSPTHNPYGYGYTSPEGVYVVFCYNEYISVRMMRIVGTLVLLSPGPGSWINDQVNWEPAVPNYPALMVLGDIDFNFTDDPLGEGGKVRTNFNPEHTPYPYSDPNGWDADQDDTYPSLIKGLVYVYGNLNVTKYPKIEGVVVVDGQFTSSQSQGPNLTYRDTFLNDPPPGFGTGTTMKISSRSWKQVVD